MGVYEIYSILSLNQFDSTSVSPQLPISVATPEINDASAFHKLLRKERGTFRGHSRPFHFAEEAHPLSARSLLPPFSLTPQSFSHCKTG